MELISFFLFFKLEGINNDNNINNQVNNILNIYNKMINKDIIFDTDKKKRI